MTPDGLLLGAKSIVSQNRQLRKELTDLEKEISLLKEQNNVMVRMQNSSHEATVHKITKMSCSDTWADHFQFLTVQSKNFTCGKIDTVHVQP